MFTITPILLTDSKTFPVTTPVSSVDPTTVLDSTVLRYSVLFVTIDDIVLFEWYYTE